MVGRSVPEGSSINPHTVPLKSAGALVWNPRGGLKLADPITRGMLALPWGRETENTLLLTPHLECSV